jgi:CBS domain-containing protein
MAVTRRDIEAATAARTLVLSPRLVGVLTTREIQRTLVSRPTGTRTLTFEIWVSDMTGLPGFDD